MRALGCIIALILLLAGPSLAGSAEGNLPDGEPLATLSGAMLLARFDRAGKIRARLGLTS